MPKLDQYSLERRSNNFMNNDDTSKLIDKILHESSLDPRIETGIFDIHNYEHMEIMAEHMTNAGVNTQIVAEVINELVMDEGKYPERQAYNKEGWLVTFPSKEYRDRAVKKGTHSISDPTHGKGGMNLYYKKKGKQQRQTQQDPTQTEPASPTNSSPLPTPNSPTLAKSTGNSELPPSNDKDGSTTEKPVPPAGASEIPYQELPPADADDELEKRLEKIRAKKAAAAAAKQGQQTNTGQQSPSPVVPSPVPISPDYIKPSKDFAIEKGWKPTPYGEWRDKQGNTKAVTGVSGEVVPLENVYRDELKIYVEKNAVAPTPPPAPQQAAPQPPA